MNIKIYPNIGIASLLLLIPLLVSCSKRPEQAGKPYPLDTCLVCDMKLNKMGKPCAFVYQEQEIKVCDTGEKSDFEKDPGKYLPKLTTTVVP